MKALSMLSRWRNRALAAALALLCLTPELAWGDEIDRIVEAHMEGLSIPGVAVYVRQNQRVRVLRGYGVGNLEDGARIGRNSLFQSGSVGKQFTSVAILMLVEEGRLSLADRLSQYFPNAPPAHANITIAQLLSHTSGLSDEAGNIDYERDYSPEELTDAILASPLACAPGDCYEYSNSGYALLGFIIEKASGQFYADFFQERIFDPLGMRGARVVDQERLTPGRVIGYERREGVLMNAVWAPRIFSSTADGSLYLSIDDFARWDAALADRRLLTARSWQAAWTAALTNDGRPNSDQYGFGWIVRESPQGRYVEHSGDWQGFHNYALRFLDRDVAIAVFTNLSPPGGSRPREIAWRILAEVAPDLAPSPPRPEDERPELTETHRMVIADGLNDARFDNLWRDGALEGERGMYAANVASDLRRAGPLQRFVLIADERENDTHLRTYEARYAHQTFTARFRLDEADQILTVRVVPEPNRRR